MNEQYTEMSVVDVLTVPKRKERLIKVLRIKGEPGIGNEFLVLVIQENGGLLLLQASQQVLKIFPNQLLSE